MPLRPAIALTLFFCLALSAQDKDQPKLNNGQLAEDTQADVYFQQHNLVAALPLYEHLTAQFPNSALYAERLASCLLSQENNTPPGPDREALRKRAKSEAERSKALGGKSNWLNLMLEQLNQDPTGATLTKNEKMRAAEAAFAKGDYDAAIVSYKELAADDPKSYEAALFVGDMYFRKHDVKSAGEWFQKAIDINPNIETAYRYWGDALFSDGEKDAALQKFIDAIVADPYNRRSWMGLGQWAQRTGATLKAPDLKLPPGPSATAGGKKGDVTITLNPDSLKDEDSGSAAWLMYGMERVLWSSSKFAKEYPNEKQYRHSLGEEADALNMVLESLKEQKVKDKKLDPNLRVLRDLGDAKMIEPYVLLSLADQGIAQDYAAYRDKHRDLIHGYIEK